MDFEYVFDNLTRTQLRILQLMGDPRYHTNVLIAARLFRSVQTVKNHVYNIREALLPKMGYLSRYQLIRLGEALIRNQHQSEIKRPCTFKYFLKISHIDGKQLRLS